MAVTLGNPKIMMFYLALLPTIIDLASVSVVGWVELTVTMAVVLIAIDLAWVFAGIAGAQAVEERARHEDRQPRQRRRPWPALRRRSRRGPESAHASY